MRASTIGRSRRAGSFGFIVLAGLAILACGGSSQDEAKNDPEPGRVVLARIGNETVTTDDIGFLPQPSKAAAQLDAFVRYKLAIAEARRRGLENEPKVRAEIARIRKNAARQEEGTLRNALFNSIRLGLEVSEEDLRAHYEKTKHRYTERQWALRMRGFPNEDAALAANAELGEAGRLDPALSEMPGPLPAEKLPRGALPMLHRLLKPGDREVVPLDRWTIVELEAYLPAAQIPFESVREKVELSLREIRAGELMRAETDRLWAEAKVEIDEEALAAWVAARQKDSPAP